MTEDPPDEDSEKEESEGEEELTFDIQVVDDEQEPVKSAKVYVSFGWWYGNSEEWTDDDGHASFEIPNCPITQRARKIQVYINGADYGEWEIEDGAGITIPI